MNEQQWVVVLALFGGGCVGGVIGYCIGLVRGNKISGYIIRTAFDRLKRPCRDCGHSVQQHNGGPEGLCCECGCMGWEPTEAVVAASGKEQEHV